MKTKINLEQYLSMGGKLENLNCNDLISTYQDKNQNVKIISFEDKGEFSTDGKSKLMNFNFENGNSNRYYIGWIQIEIDMVLPDKYTK